jgi:hypothetical protein
MSDAVILLLFPGIFTLVIGAIVLAASGTEQGTAFMTGKGKAPVDFKTLLMFTYVAAVAAYFILS